MATKYDLPNSLIHEWEKYGKLFALGDNRTTTGSGSWFSETSLETYNYTSGEEDLFNQLFLVLQDYMISATDFNNKAEMLDLNTHKAEKATDANLGHVIVDNDTIQADNGVISVPDGKFMRETKVHGDATYNDSINPDTTLTKTIALGGNYNHGIAIITSENGESGMIIFFGTNANNSLSYAPQGFGSSSTFASTKAFKKSIHGYLCPNYSYLGSPTGHRNIRVVDCYISGTNLIIKFNNTDASSQSLNCIVAWEVW